MVSDPEFSGLLSLSDNFAVKLVPSVVDWNEVFPQPNTSEFNIAHLEMQAAVLT
jgi:hypothetical protein